jgi:hypothetical protein
VRHSKDALLGNGIRESHPELERHLVLWLNEEGIWVVDFTEISTLGDHYRSSVYLVVNISGIWTDKLLIVVSFGCQEILGR